MTKLEITLSDAQASFVEEQVRSGAYSDVEAVIQAALVRLHDAANDEAKRRRFDALLQEGLDDFTAGRFEVVEDVAAWLDGLEAEVEAEAGRP